MITEIELNNICIEYNIDYKKLLNSNKNILEYGEENEIRNVLEYLKTEVGIHSEKIEKC